MKAVITYSEISFFIEKKFKIRPTFTTVDEKTVEVSYKPYILTPTIVLRLRVEEVRGDMVSISYDCGDAASMLIAGAVAYIEDKIPTGIEINAPCKRVDVHLRQLKQLNKALEYISLSDISFGKDSAYVSLMIL